MSANDLDEPLTPSHLLIGRRVLSLPDNLGYMRDPDDEDFAINSTRLDKRMNHLGNTLNHFWRRWRNEYLTELRDSHQRSNRELSGLGSTQPAIAVGDVVIVHDDKRILEAW